MMNFRWLLVVPALLCLASLAGPSWADDGGSVEGYDLNAPPILPAAERAAKEQAAQRKAEETRKRIAAEREQARLELEKKREAARKRREEARKQRESTPARQEVAPKPTIRKAVRRSRYSGRSPSIKRSPSVKSSPRVSSAPHKRRAPSYGGTRWKNPYTRQRMGIRIVPPQPAKTAADRDREKQEDESRIGGK